MIGGLQNKAAHKKAKGKSEESRRIQHLERELHRKDKALFDYSIPVGFVDYLSADRA
ncbi:MAG TPA: hypothetical protein VLL97_10505 [Acidobacteriota bacterium]|nr:hypothetical protein [Acidobacteriota bacterium]